MKPYRTVLILSCLVALAGCKPTPDAPVDKADAAPEKGEAKAPARAAIPEDLDLVILNGRVMDPETKLDAVRNVGIKSGKLVTITEQAIKGSEKDSLLRLRRSTSKDLLRVAARTKNAEISTIGGSCCSSDSRKKGVNQWQTMIS
jgi:hypothetical protein